MEESSKRLQTRARILAEAGRSFRRLGYCAGVDGVANAAGVTSGAFYACFKSKAEAFQEAVVAGMRDLEQAVRQLRSAGGDDWLRGFVDLYLGEKRTCELSESCALQSLTSEVARADDETRRAFEVELRAVVEVTAGGMPAASLALQRQRAIVTLALLSGGVSLARAVRDPALGQEIADAIRAVIATPAAPRDE